MAKEFYTRCIGYLSTLHCLDEITKVVKYVLLIATMQYDELDPNVSIGRDYLLDVFQNRYKHEEHVKEFYKGEFHDINCFLIIM